MEKLSRFAPLVPILILALLLIGPSIGLIDAVGARHIMLIAVLALMVSGLNLVLGYSGELAVGQVAFYAIGAYIVGFVGMSLGQSDVIVGLLAVIVGAIVVGLLTGVPSLRLSGWPLAMVTFFLVLIVPNLIEIFGRWTGGGQGMAVDRSTLFGAELGAYGFYVLVVAVTATWFAVVRNTILSPHGTGFLVLRQSADLAGALGMSVYRTKLKVYVLGTIAPALGGALFAWLDGFIAPDSFTFGLAITLLAASVLGGSTSIYGAILGAIVLHFTEDSLTGFNQYQLIIYGLFLAVLAIALPEGVVGLVRKYAGKFLQAPGSLVQDGVHVADTLRIDGLKGKTVVVDGIEKSFGGNRAVRGVHLTARPGEITALIGTNGSGKTTVLNMINGFMRADAGEIRLGEGAETETLSGSSVDKVARAGVMRTFQTPIMPAGVSTLDFVALGGYLTDPASLFATVLRLPSHRRRIAESTQRAKRILDLLGLKNDIHKSVDALPLGTRRLVEVARSLAAAPSVLLLDEVGSGLDEGDIERLESLLRQIRDAGVTIILVEHNFPLVMRLADHVHVLSRGETLAEGPPEQIRNDQKVAQEYLGAATSAEVEET